MTAPNTPADQEDAVREAWAYLTPHPLTNGPVILDASKMRAAITTLRAAFQKQDGEVRHG